MKNFLVEFVGGVVDITFNQALNNVGFGTSVIPMLQPPTIRILFLRDGMDWRGTVVVANVYWKPRSNWIFIAFFDFSTMDFWTQVTFKCFNKVLFVEVFNFVASTPDSVFYWFDQFLIFHSSCYFMHEHIVVRAVVLIQSVKMCCQRFGCCKIQHWNNWVIMWQPVLEYLNEAHGKNWN